MPAEPVENAGATSDWDSSDSRRLIAARLRHETSGVGWSTRTTSLPPFSLNDWLDGDAGHLHRAGDLTGVPITWHRRLGGRVVVALKRTLRRLLFPLLDVQTSLNGANAPRDRGSYAERTDPSFALRSSPGLLRPCEWVRRASSPADSTGRLASLANNPCRVASDNRERLDVAGDHSSRTYDRSFSDPPTLQH
jgi:hypothetical protein